MSREPMSQQSRVSGTGSYGNATVYRENPDTVEELTPAQVRQVYEAALAEDQAAKDRIQSGLNADGFVASHPEFLETDANIKLMKHELKRMFGESLLTPENIEASYESLKASGFLELDQKELAKQQKATARQRYKERYKEAKIRSVEPTEEEMYSMSLEELRSRADADVQKRFRLAAERGGNDF